METSNDFYIFYKHKISSYHIGSLNKFDLLVKCFETLRKFVLNKSTKDIEVYNVICIKCNSFITMNNKEELLRMYKKATSIEI